MESISANSDPLSEGIIVERQDSRATLISDKRQITQSNSDGSQGFYADYLLRAWCRSGYYIKPSNKAAQTVQSLFELRATNQSKIVSLDAVEKNKQRIENLCENTTDQAAPNRTAMWLSLSALDLLKAEGVFPSIINASGDESLLFEFYIKNDYYLVEFSNAGEIVYLSRINGFSKPAIEVSVEELKETIKIISTAYKNANL